MTRSIQWLGSLTMLAALAVSAASCAAGGDEDGEELGEAHQAQLDPGIKDYLIYTLTQGGVQIGQVLVTSTTGGGYTGSREYWYMSQNVSTSSAVTFSAGTSESWTTPPSGLGTLSFTTQRRPTWVSGTPSGTLQLYTNSLTGERVGIDWQMSNSGGTWTGTLTWWHSSMGNILGPGATETLSPSTPPSGTWYSYTTSPL